MTQAQGELGTEIVKYIATFPCVKQIHRII